MKNLTWQNPEQLFVAQELINKVKSKCCGIKVKEDKFLIINDKNNRQKVSSKGYLEYRLVKEFVKEIVNVYEHNN